jgi:hypothetical protein
LLQEPNSLFATILKEKYFSRGSFLQAKLGHKPSYAWRSLLKARQVLENGLVWRIGNGKQVKFWGNKWLLSSPDFWVHSSPNSIDPGGTSM